jgi:hypothetical protein
MIYSNPRGAIKPRLNEILIDSALMRQYTRLDRSKDKKIPDPPTYSEISVDGEGIPVSRRPRSSQSVAAKQNGRRMKVAKIQTVQKEVRPLHTFKQRLHNLSYVGQYPSVHDGPILSQSLKQYMTPTPPAIPPSYPLSSHSGKPKITVLLSTKLPSGKLPLRPKLPTHPNTSIELLSKEQEADTATATAPKKTSNDQADLDWFDDEQPVFVQAASADASNNVSNPQTPRSLAFRSPSRSRIRIRSIRA